MHQQETTSDLATCLPVPIVPPTLFPSQAGLQTLLGEVQKSWFKHASTIISKIAPSQLPILLVEHQWTPRLEGKRLPMYVVMSTRFSSGLPCWL